MFLILVFKRSIFTQPLIIFHIMQKICFLQGISQTATTIVRVAVEEHEKKGVTGAVGGVLRQIPPSIMQPFILATEATSNVLGGARNQLSPDARIEASKKWKSVQKSQK